MLQGEISKMLQALMQYSQNKVHSFASQLTAAEVMNVIARLPGCAGQAADAVSAYTQVKMEDAPSLLKIPVRMSKYLETFTKTQTAQIMVEHGRPSRSS